MKAADVKQDNFTNVGPSVSFKVRDEQGQAMEFHNYMNPVLVDGRLYFISGVRSSLNEPMRYIHIPYDPNGSLDRFLKFRQALMDKERLQYHAENFVRTNLAKEPADKKADIVANMVNLASQFNQSGYESIMQAAQNTGDSEGAMRAYINLLFYMQREVYKDVLTQEGVDVSQGVSEADINYFNAAQEALAMLPVYGTPFILQLASFEHIEASGLQITRSPAKNIVYLGCVLLIIGVFIMFYIPHNRVWLWLENQQGKVSIIMAGSTNRDRREFERQFKQISEQLDAGLKA
jgi:cytochrome c biogenesis protein